MEKSPHVMLGGAGADEFAAQRRPRASRTQLLLHRERWQASSGSSRKKAGPSRRVPPASAAGPPSPSRSLTNPDAPQVRHHRHRRPRSPRQHRRRHHHRRHAGQALRPRRRLAHHRRRHLRLQPLLRRLRHRHRRILHPPHRGPRHLRPCRLQRHEPAGCRRRGDPQGAQALKGDGGVIAITPDGQLAWGFNTPGMFRARLVEGGKVQMGVYNDEP